MNANSLGFNSLGVVGPMRRMLERRAFRGASEVPMRFNALGTVNNPGDATPLGPTFPMRFGATFNPLFRRVQDIFPESNPYGSGIENFILGDSVGITERMAEGVPYQLTGRGPSEPNLKPGPIMDLTGALPIASALTLGKAAVVPAGIYATPILSANRAIESLLGVTDAVKKAQRDGPRVSDVLLGTRLGRDPNMNVLTVAPETGLLPTQPQRFSDPDTMGFRSVVSDVVDLDSFPNRGTVEQMEAALGQKGGLSNQVRSQIGNRRIDKEELKFLGITDLLEDARRTGRPVMRDEIRRTIDANRHGFRLDEEELMGSPEDSIYLSEEVLGYEESYGPDFISEEIDYHLTDNEAYAKLLAENPDAEDQLRDEIHQMLEQTYNESPTQRIRLEASDGPTDIYAIGSDDLGWTIRKGGDNWDDSKILDEAGEFVTQRELAGGRVQQRIVSGEEEARVQLELVAQDEMGISGGGAQWREHVVEDRSMGGIGDVDGYRELVVRLPEEAGGNIGSHYGDDVAYHMRVSDREYRSGTSKRESALYVDEIQSDYAQTGAGRKLRFTEDEQTVLDNLDIDNKTKKLALRRFPTPDVLAAKEKVKAELPDSIYQKIKIDEKSYVRGALKEQPLVAGQEKWVQHAIKNLITRMVNEDKSRLIFTSGKNQADYWNEKGLENFYDKKVRNEIKEILKGIDKDAVEMVDGEADWSRKAFMQHISIKNTKKIRDFIKGIGDKPKGFGTYSAAPVAVGVGGLLNADNNAGDSMP